MGLTLKSTFATRRDAELAVEHLVQEHGIERRDIFVAPEGSDNSAGEKASGSDRAARETSEEARSDGALNGRIEVSVDLQDDGLAPAVHRVFADLGGIAA